MKNINKDKLIGMGILLFAITMLECLTMVNAETYQLNKQVNIMQTCNNCTYCTATVLYPNSTMFLNNVSMIKYGTNFNYSIDANNITVLGTYNWYYTCGNGIEIGTGKLNFLVTTSGYDANITQGVMIFFIFAVVIVLAILFFIIGLRTEFMGVKLFFLSMTVILMVFLIGYIVNVTNITLGEFPSLTSGFTPLYILFVALLTVGAVGLIVYLIAYAFQAFYKSRGWRD